jgi:hypothetical protein
VILFAWTETAKAKKFTENYKQRGYCSLCYDMCYLLPLNPAITVSSFIYGIDLSAFVLSFVVVFLKYRYCSLPISHLRDTTVYLQTMFNSPGNEISCAVFLCVAIETATERAGVKLEVDGKRVNDKISAL